MERKGESKKHVPAPRSPVYIHGIIQIGCDPTTPCVRALFSLQVTRDRVVQELRNRETDETVSYQPFVLELNKMPE